MTTRPTRTLLAVLLALGGLAAACSSDDGDVASSGDSSAESTAESAVDSETAVTEGLPESGTFPVTVTSGGVETTVDAAPEAIVSISPSATEMVFAIGAGEAVIAVDSYSNYPPEAPITDLSAFDPNVEAVIAYEPDLVVLSDDRNDLVAGLDAVGIPALVLPAAATLDDTYSQIEVLGTVTGHDEEAEALVEQMQSDIEELVASVPPTEEPLTYFHELDNTLYSVTSSTFIGELYGLAGLVNIADAADADGASGGYPQLSAEYLVESDPDLVFLADTKCCNEDATTFGARPGFGELSAVRAGNVIALDDDIASRWGPRVVDFLTVIVESVAATTTS